MAKQGSSSSRMLNSLPHFFQPLLPGFRDHFSIPAGFGKYLEGREVGEEIAVLRSTCGKIYRVKMEKGRAFRDGWKEFVDEHGLHVGDVVVFRLVAAPMVFDVIIFDPSACERPYLPQNADLKTAVKEEVKEETALPCAADLPKPETEFQGEGDSGTPMERNGKDGPSEPEKPYFVVSIHPDNLKNYRQQIPKYFASKNGLNAMSTEAIILNEEGTSWPVMIKCYCRPSSATYIQRGWRAFQKENELKLGDTFNLELVQGGQKLILRMSGLRANPVLERKYREKPRMERRKNVKEMVKKEATHHDQVSTATTVFSSMADAHFMLTITSQFVRGISLRIPHELARYSGLYGASRALLLTNEKGGEWLVMVETSTNDITYIASGWTELVNETGLNVGDTLKIDLVERGMNPVMTFKVVSRNPSVPKEEEKP